MRLVVQKYGGSSVADADKIKNVARRVVRTKETGCGLVVVVSALGETTDTLISLANQITDDPVKREFDVLLSTGEQISIALLAMAIHELGVEAISFTGSQVGILTDVTHTRARILSVDTDRIEKELKDDKVIVVAGFQGETETRDITTLGRGGSDTTAVALASALRADVCEIYTDVEGVFTADPRIVPEARKIPVLSYDDMLELASMGSTVLQTRSVLFAKKYKVPLRVRSTFTDDPGTLITEEVKSMERVVVSGVTLDENEAKITLFGVPDKPGVAARTFTDIASANINIDMIVQNVSESGLSDISFTVTQEDLKRTLAVTKAIAKAVDAKGVDCDDKIAKVSVVGIGMRNHSGVAAAMFRALGDAGINIEMISTSEIKISCVVRGEHGKQAVKEIHSAFNLDSVEFPEGEENAEG